MNATTATWGTELRSSNASDQALPQWPLRWKIMILAFLDIIIALVGLAGNATVLWLLGCRMRRKSFSIYILNLAAADFLFLFTHIIRSLLKVTYSLHCIPRISLFFTAFFYLVSLGMLSAISTERCGSVLWPIWFHHHRPKHLSTVVCALLWGFSLLLSILEGHHCSILFGNLGNFSYWCKILNFTIASWTIFLCMILAGCSLALLTKMFYSPRRMPLTRLYVSIMLSVLVFLLCGLPPGMVRFFGFQIQKNSMSTHYLTWALFIMSGINSSINPIIYFFVGSFRWQQGQSFKLVLQKALDDTAEVGRSGERSLQETKEIPGSRSGSNSLPTRVHAEK